MTDVLVIGMIVAVLAVSTGYIVKAKKRGVKCIGCPAGGKCSGACQNK